MSEASRDRPMTDRERRRTTMTAKITSPQTKNINRLMEDALGEASPDKDGAQRLIGQGGDFKIALMALIGYALGNYLALLAARLAFWAGGG